METSSFQLQPPTADAQVRHAALQGSRLAALWSDGTLQAYNPDIAKLRTQADGGKFAPVASLPLRGFAFSVPQVRQQAASCCAGMI